jgi:purine-binding chemotaxis protein CheW
MAEKQFVIFKLGEQNYCADIMNVGGITEYKGATKVPEAPYFVEGVINLRGSIIPIINLKKRFNIPETRRAEDCRVVLFNLAGMDIGFLVDEANQVIKIESENIDPTPEILKGEDKDYIDGVGKVGDAIVIVLDLAKVLTDGERNQVEHLQI